MHELTKLKEKLLTYNGSQAITFGILSLLIEEIEAEEDKDEEDFQNSVANIGSPLD